MGVNHLWSILAPVKTHKSLKSLQGQTIAVDLSVWICESSSALQGLPVVKPHLRNLFFRVTNLTQMGVNLVFVLDGEPPELKWDEMERRTKARFEGEKGHRWRRYRSKRVKAGGEAAPEGDGGGGKKKTKRSRFKYVLNECAEMLANLGIPCLQAAGEAEAMCALLNKQGLVDACLTEDGDVFLYGARTVYKNFSLNTKDPHVECYSMEDIESHLGLDQSKLIALALLLGCDYTLGVLGVGQKQALGLMNQVTPGVNILERFQDWADGRVPRECLDEEAPKKTPHCSKCTHVGSGKEHKVYGCALCKTDVACSPKSAVTVECSCPWHASAKLRGRSSLERDVMKKALATPGFPGAPVVEEFLAVRDKCPERTPTWRRPQLIGSQKFISAKLEWPEDYTIEKVFPLVTLWDLMDLASGQPFDPALHVMPSRVVKKRTRQGVACVEIQWQTGVPHSEQEFPTTIEREELFAKAFPELMRAFEDEKKASKTKQKRKKPKSAEPNSSEEVAPESYSPTSSDADLEYVTSAVSELSLSQPTHLISEDRKTPASVTKKSPSNELLCRSTEGASLTLPSEATQRAKPASKSKETSEGHPIKLRSSVTSHSEMTTRVTSDEESDTEMLDDVVRRKNPKSCSDLSGRNGREKRSVINKTTPSQTSGNGFNEENNDSLKWLESYLPTLCNIASSSKTDGQSSTSNSTGAFHHITVKPINRKLSQSKQHPTTAIISHSSSYNDTEPLPLSERLRLRKVLETKSSLKLAEQDRTDEVSSLPVNLSSSFPSIISVDDSSSSSSSVEEVTGEASLSLDVSSSLLSECPDGANFSLGFELTKILSHDDSVQQSKQLTSIVEDLDDESPQIESMPSSEDVDSGRSQVKGIIPLCPSTQNSASDSDSNKELPKDVETGVAVPRRTNQNGLPLQKMPVCPSVSACHLNFSLKFELTNILHEDDSLFVQNQTHLTGKETEERTQTKEEVKFSSTGSSEPEPCKAPLVEDLAASEKMGQKLPTQEDQKLTDEGASAKQRTDGTKQRSTMMNKLELNRPCKCVHMGGDDANYAAIRRNILPGKEKENENRGSIYVHRLASEKENCPPFDGDHVLNEGHSTFKSPCQIHSQRIDTPMQTPGSLCRTFAPIPIDVDTPTLVEEPVLGISIDPQHSKPTTAKEHCQPIKMPVSHAPSQSEDLIPSRAKCRTNLGANCGPPSLLNSQSKGVSHEEDNSPVSLLDRLKIKHGNQDRNGVLSAALSMKQEGKFGRKQERDRKVLMEIFDDDDDDDDDNF